MLIRPRWAFALYSGKNIIYYSGHKNRHIPGQIRSQNSIQFERLIPTQGIEGVELTRVAGVPIFGAFGAVPVLGKFTA